MNGRWNGAISYDWVPVFVTEKRIPKILHQVFSSTDPLPEELVNNVRTLKNLNSSWMHRLYNQDRIVNFIVEEYGFEMLRYYSCINLKYGAARADFFRYLLMYRCGGVYLDIKSSLGKPLDAIIKDGDQYLLSYWRNQAGESFPGWGMHEEVQCTGRGEFQQWHIVAVAGHPFLRAVIQRVMSNIDTYETATAGVGFHGVFRLTGGIAYTLAILPLLAACPHRLVDSQFELGFVYSICEKSWHAHQTLFGATDYRYQTAPIILSNDDISQAPAAIRMSS